MTTPKTYPLDVYSVGIDDYMLMSKGHHDRKAFMLAAAMEGWLEEPPPPEMATTHRRYPCMTTENMSSPTHRWMKAVPDSTGEHRVLYVPVKESTRGAFPVTISQAVHKDDSYYTEHPVEAEQIFRAVSAHSNW